MQPLLDLQKPLLGSLVRPFYLGASALVLLGAALSVISSMALVLLVPLQAFMMMAAAIIGAAIMLAAIRMLSEVATIAYGLDGNRHVRLADIAALKQTVQK
jgi:hypothetical protein